MKRLLAAASVAMAMTGAAAAADYPTQATTLVVPYGTGGASDLAGRAMAELIRDRLGQPMTVINQPGAGGMVGARAVSEADPDGYTLLLSRVGMALSPAVDPDNSVPWDAYSFIEILEVTPMILAVRADAPYESVADLMAAIEAADGGMTYAASGATAIDGFTVQALLDDHGMDPLTAATLVPYDGGGALATALLGGSVDFVAIASASLMPHIEAGTVKALGVYSPVRMAALPDVPTMEELGHAGAGQVIGWSGFYGPPGLSDTVLATLREAVLDVGADDRWIELAEARGSTSTIGLYDDVPTFVEGQYEFFRGLAERFGYLN